MSGDELGPLSRGLLDAARGAIEPDAGAAARVRAKVALAISAGAVGAATAASGGGATASAASATATASAATGSATGASAAIGAASAAVKVSLLAKLGAALVVAGALAGGGVAVHSQLASHELAKPAVVAPIAAAPARVQTPRPVVQQVQPPAIAVAQPEALAPAPAPAEIEIEIAAAPAAPIVHKHIAHTEAAAAEPGPAPESSVASAPFLLATPEATLPPARIAAPAVAPAPVAAPVAAPPVAPAPVVRRASLAREVVLVDRAVAALRSGDARAALTTLGIYAKETTGTGQLAEDAAAIEVEALCRLHDPSANERRAAFDARWPHSTEGAHAAAACK